MAGIGKERCARRHGWAVQLSEGASFLVRFGTISLWSIAAAAQAVLDARASFKGQTLADLYDPLAMPKALRDAHRELDRAVDRCYRAAPFTSERQRVEYLFDLYQKLVTPLTAEKVKQPRAARKPKAKEP